jgi:hypothetical protein
MSNYTLEIKIDDVTLSQLKLDKMNLFIFKSVETSAPDGKALVWQRYPFDQLGTNITFKWEILYQAFFTSEDIDTTTEYSAVTVKDIETKQCMNIHEDTTYDVTNDGTANNISIYNQNKNNRYTCGISQKNNDTIVPMCAFALPINSMDVIRPIEKIALMFASDTIKTATVYERTKGDCIVVDMTNNNSRTVNYNKNVWTADTLGHVDVYGPKTLMSDILINVTDELKNSSNQLLKNKQLLEKTV